MKKLSLEQMERITGKAKSDVDYWCAFGTGVGIALMCNPISFAFGASIAIHGAGCLVANNTHM